MDQNEMHRCTSCLGTGKCFRCSGAGSILRHTPVPITVLSGQVGGNGETWRVCPQCQGSGMCQTCKGTGKPV